MLDEEFSVRKVVHFIDKDADTFMNQLYFHAVRNHLEGFEAKEFER